jgi:hypothetical protein
LQSTKPDTNPIHITSTNTDVVEGQSHTITCSISGISDITGITWIKTSATGDKIAIVVGEDMSDYEQVLTSNNVCIYRSNVD